MNWKAALPYLLGSALAAFGWNTHQGQVLAQGQATASQDSFVALVGTLERQIEKTEMCLARVEKPVGRCRHSGAACWVGTDRLVAGGICGRGGPCEPSR